MEIGKSYIIKFNNQNETHTFIFTGTYVGNNIYNQETFKINDKCNQSECDFFKNPKVAYEIIKDELKNNKLWENYYQSYGSRVYAVVNDPKDIKINFLAAKKLGAVYVLSKYQIKSINLEAVCENCNNDSFYLYKII